MAQRGEDLISTTPGTTVSDYIRKAAELRPDLNPPSRKGNPAGMLMEDISWDEGRGWIEVEVG